MAKKAQTKIKPEKSEDVAETEKLDITKLSTINVGIVGHIDHGKTTLLQRLTGKWADTHSEELKRGITIKLGYADAIIREEANGVLSMDKKSTGKPLRYVTFVDAPGHEMLMATMLSGAAIIDAAILVIAANEGIKPQTREHLIALKTKKIENILVVQNKIDLVSREDAIKSYNEIKEFVKGSPAENSVILPISGQQGVNVDKIISWMSQIKVKEKSLSEKPVFFIARSFDVNRPGTEVKKLHGGILGGSLKQGVFKIGDEIEIKPGYSQKKHNDYVYQTLHTKIVSMHKGEYTIQEGTPGGSLALETELDPILTKADSLAGCVVSLKGNLPEITSEVNLKYELFEKVFFAEGHEKIENLKTNELLMLSVNTAISIGMVKKIKGNIVTLGLKIPIVPLKGDSVGIARNIRTKWRLVGFAEIV